jgi:large subunit ribosomal protein L21
LGQENQEKPVYAIVKTGGRQFRVAPEEKIKIPKLEGKAGDKLTLDHVLFVEKDGAPVFGRPLIEGAKVLAEVVSQGREEKIIVFHKRRRKGYMKKNGHRQPYTEIRVTSIVS